MREKITTADTGYTIDDLDDLCDLDRDLALRCALFPQLPPLP